MLLPRIGTLLTGALLLIAIAPSLARAADAPKNPNLPPPPKAPPAPPAPPLAPAVPVKTQQKPTIVEQAKRAVKAIEAAKIDIGRAKEQGIKAVPPQAKTNPKLVKVKPEDIARPPVMAPRVGVQQLNPSSFGVQTRRNYISVVRFALKRDNSKEQIAMFARMEKKYSSHALFAEVVVKYDVLFAECTPYIYAGLPAVVIIRNGIWQAELRGPDATNEKELDRMVKSHIDTFTNPIFRQINDVENLNKVIATYAADRPIAFVFNDPAVTMNPMVNAFKFAAITLHDHLGLSIVCFELRSPKLLPVLFNGNETSLKSPVLMSVPTKGGAGHRVLNFAPGYEDPIELEKFLFLNAIPTVWSLQANTGRYFTGGKPLVAFLSSSNSKFELDMMQIFHNITKKFEGQFHFVTADLRASKFFTSLPSRDRKKLESGFAIISTGHLGMGMKRYVFGGEKSEEGLSEWIRMFLGGELEKKETKKPEDSKPVGLIQRGAVVNLETGDARPLVREIREDDWNAHVLDGERDVIAVQYASRCAACHSFAPVLEEVALALSHVPSLEFVSINLDNENVPSPFRASRIPYVLLFPANRKARPVSFRMRRMKRHSLIRFIKRNAAIRFTARNRDVEVFYARTLTFSVFWLLMTGIFLKKTKRAHLFVSRVEERFREFDKRF